MAVSWCYKIEVLKLACGHGVLGAQKRHPTRLNISPRKPIIREAIKGWKSLKPSKPWKYNDLHHQERTK